MRAASPSPERAYVFENPIHRVFRADYAVAVGVVEVLPVYLRLQPRSRVRTALEVDIVKLNDACSLSGRQYGPYEIGEALCVTFHHAGLLCLQHTQRTDDGVLAFLSTAIELTTKCLRLDVALPNNRAAIHQRDRLTKGRQRNEVFPIESCHAAVVHDAEITALRPDGREHILVIVFLRDEWLSRTFQRDVIIAGADVQRVHSPSTK